MKKLLIIFIVLFCINVCNAASITIKNPVFNTTIPVEIYEINITDKNCIPCAPYNPNENGWFYLSENQEVEIEVRILPNFIDINYDDKEGLAEVIYLLQILVGIR